MTNQPYVYIDPPTVEPYRYGLFSAAQPLDLPDEHWRYGGVEFDPLASYPGQLYPVGVGLDAGAGGTKTLPSWLGTTKALPFAVYGGVLCGTLGHDNAAARQRALRVVELAGQHSAENALWTGGAGETPSLNAATDAQHVTVSGTATSLRAALVALENWLGDHYNGRGTLHARRGVGVVASNLRLSHRDPDDATKLVTPVGTQWVFGGGYDGTGPAAVAPSAGQTWIYATGQVGIGRGPADTPAGLGEALDRLHNQVQLLAEQEYIVAVDGIIGAALVDLTL